MEELQNEKEQHFSTRHLLDLCQMNASALEQDKANLENIINAAELNEEAAFDQLSKLNKENLQLQEDIKKEERRKRRWRTATGVFAIVTLVLGAVVATN